MNSIIKQFFIVLCLSILTIPLQAQDLIVTQEDDSLNCKITQVKADYIYFTYKYKDEIRNSLLPVNQIVYYQENYYPTAEVPADKIPGYNSIPHFRIAISGGWSYLIAPVAESVSPDFKEYIKKLKSGFHYDISFSYYFNKFVGIGCKYNVHHSSNEMGGISLEYPDGRVEYGKMSDNLRINFIGPFFTARFFARKTNNCLLLDAGLGYVGYRNKQAIVSHNLTMTGFTIGLYTGVGYDIALSQNWALGFQFSLITGVLTQYKLTDGIQTETVKPEANEQEGISRINLSVGLRFNK